MMIAAVVMKTFASSFVTGNSFGRLGPKATPFLIHTSGEMASITEDQSAMEITPKLRVTP